MEVGDVGADGGDFADELMADDHGDGDGLLGPLVPLVNVDVGAADAGLADADQDVVNAKSGSGTSSSQRPRSAWALTSARMVLPEMPL